MNWHPKYVLSIPFIGSISIVLNLYNGDILGISNNFEYLLWYIPPFLYFLKLSLQHYWSKHVLSKWDKFIEYFLELLLCFLGIVFNVYWHYAEIHDAKYNYRHQTEYYDTQTLLCGMMYSILHNQFHLDFHKKHRTGVEPI